MKKKFKVSYNPAKKNTNKYNQPTEPAVSAMRLFWDSRKLGTYVRSRNKTN